MKKQKKKEQNESVICTINTDSNHISNKVLVTQKETTKILIKQRSPDWDIIIMRVRKSTLIAQEWENWSDDRVYIDQITDESYSSQVI